LRVERWLEDDPYPRAEVEDWEDDPQAELPGAESYAALLDEARDVLALAAEAGVAVGELGGEVADDPRLGTFEVAGALPIGPLDRHRVLSTDGAAARVALLRELVLDVRILLEASR